MADPDDGNGDQRRKFATVTRRLLVLSPIGASSLFIAAYFLYRIFSYYQNSSPSNPPPYPIQMALIYGVVLSIGFACIGTSEVQFNICAREIRDWGY